MQLFRIINAEGAVRGKRSRTLYRRMRRNHLLRGGKFRAGTREFSPAFAGDFLYGKRHGNRRAFFADFYGLNMTNFAESRRPSVSKAAPLDFFAEREYDYFIIKSFPRGAFYGRLRGAYEGEK